MKRLFVYDPENPRREEVLRLACESIREAGKRLHLQVGPPKKSREQEEHYHAQIGDIAKQVRFCGRELPAESWKRLLIDAFKHDTRQDPDLRAEWDRFGELELVPALNHDGVVAVGEQSRQFSVRLASAFIDWLYAYGAEEGVRWSDMKPRAAA